MRDGIYNDSDWLWYEGYIFPDLEIALKLARLIYENQNVEVNVFDNANDKVVCSFHHIQSEAERIKNRIASIKNFGDDI